MTEFKAVSQKIDEIASRICEVRTQREFSCSKMKDCQLIMATLESPELVASLARFERRLGEKDPVTEAPRYGPQMTIKVKDLLQKVKEIRADFFESLWPQVQIEHEQFQKDEEERQRQAEQERLQQEQEEAERLKESQAKQSQLERLQAEEEAKRKEEEASLAAQAELAREAKKLAQEAEDKARAAAQEALEAELYTVPVSGEGVLQALDRLKVATGPDTKEYKEAIGALNQMFAVIVAHPEEIRYRKINLTNALFQSRIGQYDGGKQVFVGAGFRLLMEDEQNFLFLKEPDLMSDFDGWSEWFNLIKATKEIIDDCI